MITMLVMKITGMMDIDYIPVLSPYDKGLESRTNYLRDISEEIVKEVWHEVNIHDVLDATIDGHVAATPQWCFCEIRKFPYYLEYKYFFVCNSNS